MANQKHVFDFEGILNMDINQKNWRDIKQKLDSAFGELKISIADGMAKADAEKYVKMFNQVFGKVKMPDIGVEDLKEQFDQVAESFTKAIASLHNIDISALKNIEGSLDHIVTQVDKIVDKVGKGVPNAAKSAVLSVKQLDDILGKLGESAKDVEGSLNFSIEGDAKKQSAALRKISNELQKLEEDGAKDAQSWLKRQQTIVKYVQAYESYAKVAKKPNKDLTDLYNKLLPKSYDARTNLQNLSDRRAGTYSEHKEPWAKEETLKKVLDVLQNGIKVEDKGGKDPSKDPTKTPPKRDVSPNSHGVAVYRTVYKPEEEDNRSRKEILESWGGAEYWTNKKGVAETYADGQEEPVILKGTIVSDKPFVIDAKGKTWDKFLEMFVLEEDENNPSSLREVSLIDKFPELFTKVANGEFSDPADIQAELNKSIKQLGHDVIEMRNVIDTNNPASFKELSTTYAVLDDRILRVEKAFAMEEQDRDGITTFEKTAYTKNIPEYYKMPEISEVISEVVKEQVQTNVPKTQETSSENHGAISEISAKMDKLATDATINTVKDAIISAITMDNDGKVNINATTLTEALSKIQVAPDNNDVVSAIQALTQQLSSFIRQEDAPQGVKATINAEELKTVLNTITYNVKVVKDEDSTDNKVAINETSLETTLNKVFANILNPQTLQNDSDTTQESWALESTLQTVKGVLDNIQTNTAKFGTIEISNVDAIAGSALEGKLTEIKTVLESIDNKIAKGGVIATRGAVKQANAQPVESEARAQAARSNMMKSLINDYKTMGKLAAQFASDGNLETKAMLDNLKDEIARKRQSLKITMDENKSLREKYSIAFDAEKRLLDAAKAQKAIDKQAKQKDRDDKATWQKKVKDAQRATGINAATTAANAGDQTVMRAIGSEGVSKDIENKAKELSDQIKTLRALRDDIDKKGNKASEADRDNLSKQITKVKELKTEVDGYLKIHEKYSGEGVTDLGDASNFGAVGTNQYWDNITAAIKKASTGRVTIKGMNADTGELAGTTKIAANTFAEWSATVDPITGRLSILRTGIKKTETVIEAITRKTKEVFTYFSGSSIIFKAFNELKKGIQYVREIDLALTELKKVTNETEETYDRFLETAAKTADKVGSTIQKVVSSTADWARLGYSMKEAAEFAETTQILMNVSEFTDVSQATDTLISAVQAFGYTAETSMDVVDLLNTIGNNYAISTADLAQSLTKSSASLVAAGGDLAEAVALTATANAIIQDADSVGTALKTTSLRLRGTSVKVLEEEGLDTDGAVESTSKLRSQVLATSGVDILTDSGAYKSTYQILLEIAEVWDRITDDKARAGLLELLAGKRNSSVIAALLQNPEDLKAAYEDAQNASGSALKENEKYLDSIQGKIDQFNNAVQSLWADTLDSDVVKFFVDLATQLVKLVDAVGPLNIAFVGLVAFLEKKHGIFSNFFDPAESGVEEIINQIDESFDSTKAKKQISGKKGAITKRAKKLESEGKTFAEIQEDPKIKQWTQEVQEGQQALDEYNLSVQRADDTLRQSNITISQATAIENTHTNAETAGASATSASVAAEIADTTATAEHTAATWADVWAEMTRTGATGESVAATIKQVIATKLASSALVQKGLSILGVTAAEGASIPVTTMLAGAFVGLGSAIWSAITAMWTFMTTTPIGWILLAVGAVVALGTAFAAMHKSTEELQEDLDGMKSKLSDVRSELESVNSELETTNDRIAELLAKDSLTFVEQEELDRLINARTELERYKELLKEQEKEDASRVGRQAARVVNSKRNEIGWWLNGKSEDEEVLDDIEDYKKLIEERDNASSLKDRNKIQEKLDNKSGEIDEYIAVISEALDGVKYGDSPESDAALDYLAEIQDTYAIARGSESAKTNSIKGVLSKDEFSSTKIAIDQYVKALEDGDAKAADSIDKIIKNNKNLVEDLEARGLKAQDAVDYFTKLGDVARFDTPEGKTKEIERAKATMSGLMAGFKSGIIDVDSLFDEDGKILQAKLGEMFKGTSEKTRDELTQLLEGAYNQIADGLSDGEMDSLIERFGLKMELSLLDIKNAALADQNIELFPNLKDEIDGVIDSFNEMSSALHGVVDAMDLLEQARAEEAYSGSISLETMMKLMEQTDDYTKLLEIDEYGAIKLVEGAESSLIDERIEKVKTDAKASLQAAENAYQQAVLAEEDAKLQEQEAEHTHQTVTMTGPSQQWYTGILAELSGWVAYVQSLWNDVTSGNFSGSLERASAAYNNTKANYAQNKYKEKVAAAENSLAEARSNRESATTNRENAEKKLKNAQFMSDYAESYNPDNVKSKVDSDTASGGNNTEDEVKDDAFQKEMDYWENRIAANQAKYEQLQNEIDLMEKKGQKADASFYEEQIQLENERKWLLEQQKIEAQAFLSTLEEGSEKWF